MDTTDKAIATVLLFELDSDDEKSKKGKTHDWVKRRRRNGYFTNIVKELKIEDRQGFKDIFFEWMQQILNLS